jgi:serine/threonine-protein kinase ULK/ATG1
MEYSIKGYKFLKQIGKGVSSKVYLAQSLKDGKTYAIKQIERTFIKDKRYKKYINNEIFILKNIKNDYIIKFYEIIMDTNYIHLVFEYCNGGDLDKCLKKQLELHNKSFSQEVVQHIMRQVIAGFVYLHSSRILHRDIKLENILVQFPTEEDKENLNMMKAKFKITDFGFARYLKENKMAESVLGNAINMEPHILRKLARIDNETSFGYDQKADIWSLGTITYELLIGCPTFEASSYEELSKKIEEGEYRIPHEINISKEAIYFLTGMLRYDPSTRLDIESLNKQHFITRDVSTFHNIHLKRNKKNLGESIILNVKRDNNSNLEELLSQYNDINMEIDVSQTQDLEPREKIPQGKRIKANEEDYVGGNIINPEQNIKIGDKKEENLENNMNDYLNKLFDQMNKDCFKIEPLLIPTQPNDGNFDSSDPITKYMNAL